MSPSEEAICTLLVQVRGLLDSALDEVRPETEYLRDEINRLQGQVDILQVKVEKERRLLADKAALL